MTMKRYQMTAAAVSLMLLTGCGMFTPMSGTDPSAASVPEQLSSAETAGSVPDSVTESSESSEASDVTPEALAELTAGAESVLPLTADFFRWASETTGDPDLCKKLSDQIAQEGYSDSLWYPLSGMTAKAAAALYDGLPERDSRVIVLEGDGNPGISMTFAGDISLADNWHVMQYLKTTENGISDCISPFLNEKMRAADINCINNEFCFSNRGTPLANKQYTFRGAPENVSVYGELGVDIVDLANNHAFDYGEDAFLDTMETLRGAGIAYMGGGKDLAEASAPVYYIVEGKMIAFVAATRAEKFILTPEAGASSPGVLRCYDPAAFLEVIRQAKTKADFVIANLHWGTENSHALEDVQPETAYQYIDAGADLIIGAHAHCLQGIEYYRHVPIVYNLGNYWFSHYDIDTGLLGVNLTEDDAVEMCFYPAVQRGCKTTYVGGEAEGERILQCMRSYSVNADFAADGTVTERSAG